MSDTTPEEDQPTFNLESIARLFTRLGWIGFWLQVALAILPIVMVIYVVFRSTPGPQVGRRFDFREYVAFGSLLILLFTMFWSYRYTRLGKQMLTPEGRPASSSAVRTLWIGVFACWLGASTSIMLLLGSVGRLLFVFMNAPQGGMQVIQTVTEKGADWVSTMDMLDLMTMVFTTTAELAVMGFSLWLLYRMLRCAADYDRASGTPTPAAV